MEANERTIARKVYERLLLARYAAKFIVAKVLRRFCKSISDSRTGEASYVHRAALSIRTFMARYQQRFVSSLEGDKWKMGRRAY